MSLNNSTEYFLKTMHFKNGCYKKNVYYKYSLIRYSWESGNKGNTLKSKEDC